MKTTRPPCVILHLNRAHITYKSDVKLLQRGCKWLLCAAAFFAFAALAPKANAQISINIGGPPPVCPYGYYDYAPYACAPVGFYGPGYFYNGIFLGVGPWRHWGYRHGWGSHRFVASGGGRYRPRPYHGNAYHGRPGNGHGGPAYRSTRGPGHPGPHTGAVHSSGGRPSGRPAGGRPSGGHDSGGHDSGGHGH